MVWPPQFFPSYAHEITLNKMMLETTLDLVFFVSKPVLDHQKLSHLCQILFAVAWVFSLLVQIQIPNRHFLPNFLFEKQNYLISYLVNYFLILKIKAFWHYNFVPLASTLPMPMQKGDHWIIQTVPIMFNPAKNKNLFITDSIAICSP